MTVRVTNAYSLATNPRHIHHSEWQVMNEIALHRGSSPHLNTIDIYVDGQHLTEAVVCPVGQHDWVWH